MSKDGNIPAVIPHGVEALQPYRTSGGSGRATWHDGRPLLPCHVAVRTFFLIFQF
jgi:hypothetical protein